LDDDAKHKETSLLLCYSKQQQQQRDTISTNRQLPEQCGGCTSRRLHVHRGTKNL